MAATDLSPNIGSVGQGPAAVSGDAGSVTAQRLADLAAADRYLAAKAGRSNKRRGMLFTKLIPAGAMPDSQGTGIGFPNFDNPGGIW